MTLLQHIEHAIKDAPLSGDYDQDARNLARLVVQTIFDRTESPRVADEMARALNVHP